ncbi:unnamed protein product [Caenorhabditis angaria]|uniref:Uncharacterized protein n=1 Tax=Caenorhabditis angaria TaxID=860376 RepID=A0A9P1N219_9PELO|nr:unnamed protein product [Caenorhabditis angaria]
MVMVLLICAKKKKRSKMLLREGSYLDKSTSKNSKSVETPKKVQIKEQSEDDNTVYMDKTYRMDNIEDKRNPEKK